MSANYTPSMESYKPLTPFKMQVQTNFPYIEADFDAITNYELLCRVVDYLNTVIANENAVETNVTALYNAYVSLQAYVNDYFDNLNLQTEVNKKLDEMVEDGTITNLIKGYVDPIYEAYETEINGIIEEQNTSIANQNLEISNFKSSVNSQIDYIDNKVDSATSGSPKGVYASVSALTTADPDHDYIYVVTETGKWYYYDGDSWEIGGTYQATQIAENDILQKNISSFGTHRIIFI